MKKPYSETREERNQRAHDERRNKRGIFVSIEDADAFRDFAASLDLYTTRGPMAGQVGSMEALAACFARLILANPDALREIIKPVLPPARSAPGASVPD